jgi:hypothetical protein
MQFRGFRLRTLMLTVLAAAMGCGTIRMVARYDLSWIALALLPIGPLLGSCDQALKTKGDPWPIHLGGIAGGAIQSVLLVFVFSLAAMSANRTPGFLEYGTLVLITLFAGVVLGSFVGIGVAVVSTGLVSVSRLLRGRSQNDANASGTMRPPGESSVSASGR